MVPLALWGILINLSGGISTALGWAVQKYAHKDAIAENTGFYTQWLWWVGLVCVIIAQPLYIISSSMANQSTLGVIGPFSIIVNIVFARVMLNEKVTKWEYGGILLFIPGIIVTLKYASMKNERLNREQFNDTFYSKVPMTYLMINLVLIAVMAVVSNAILKVHPPNEYKEFVEEQIPELGGDDSSDEENCDDYFLGANGEEDTRKRGKKPYKNGNGVHKAANGKLHGLNKLSNLGKSNSFFANPRWKSLPLIIYPYMGAFCASISTMLVRMFTGFGVAEPPEGQTSNFYGVAPIIYGIILVTCAVLSYLIVNKGLKHYDSVYVAPLFKIAGMIHNLMSGGIFLNEFGDYRDDQLKFLGFLGGISI